MARTIQEIYDAMAAVKADQPELIELVPDLDSSQALLTELTTTSRVARWRLIMWTVAVAMWVHEKLWDVAKAELEAIASASHIGTLRWYVEKAKAFQYGYDLEIVNNVPQYISDVPAARIVARAAGKEEGGYVLLKVAKLDGTDVVPLDVTELGAFTTYVDEIKMAGVIVNIISADPDLLIINATVYYDPLVIAPDGSLILTPSVKPVEDAIRNYIANLPFNGAFVLTALVDAMQAAQGVVNPVLGLVQSQYGVFPPANVSVQYIAHAGHAIVDPLNDLATTITYTPYVV